MSRTSRVPYHQNVYDLLGIEPGESPEAARMIAAHEAAHGPLPASVREWYLVPKMVPLVIPQNSWAVARQGTLWYEFSNQDRPDDLTNFLSSVAAPRTVNRKRFAQLVTENQSVSRWYLLLNGKIDPPVWCAPGRGDDAGAWQETTPSFSAFTTQWFAEFYVQDWTPISKYGDGIPEDENPVSVKPYLNGLWLRVPDEPFQPPVIDFLTDHFGEPERTPRAGGVTTHTFRPPGGTIRVTADEPALTGGLSAWWVHADTAERLAEFARLLLPWGTLRETLRADTDAAREVLHAAREAASG